MLQHTYCQANLPRLAQLILDNLPQECTLTTNNCYIIGLSGGVDSVVLLHLFKLLQNEYGFNLQAIHVNHNISVNASTWQDFCEKLCHELHIPLTTFQHTITRNGGESLENNARKLRYQSFTEFYTKLPPTVMKQLKPIIVLAHHQDDQIETILSQIFRGSDLHNISAMKPISTKIITPDAHDNPNNNANVHINSTNIYQLFWRPLLNITKSEILDYATEHKLQHIEDESNSDTTYLRNFLRKDILPRLQSWDPHINNKILKFNHYTKTAIALIDEIAQTDLLATTKIKPHEATKIGALKATTMVIDVIKFKQLSATRQHNLISHFILLCQIALPSDNQIHEFCRQVNNSAWDRSPELKLSDTYSIKKHKNKIIITPYPKSLCN